MITLDYCHALQGTWEFERLVKSKSKLNNHRILNPLKPNSSICYTLPHWPNLQFLISDIQALWRSALSGRVPECQKLKIVR